ncbi:MAG: hypothetical protein ABIA37_03875 [Candidatus Woesearchaeota archaeon]
MDKPLEERIRHDVAQCLQKGTYRRKGEDKEGYVCNYCTYYFLNSQQQPYLCEFRGEIIPLKKEINGFFTYVEYYLCQRRKRKYKLIKI